MHRFLKLFCLLITLLQVVISNSQDIQFSQFYAVPLYQNPAFAGSAHRTRAILHQRLQWPRLDAKYVTSLFSVDHYLANYKSGIGLMVFRDWQGGGTINSTDVSLHYSYEVNLSSQLTFRPGLTISAVNRSIDYARLRFPSQYNDTTGFVNGSLSPLSGEEPRLWYPDIGSGGIIYSDKIWFGFAAHHLNLPNQSFVKNVARLPIKASFTGGYKIVINEAKNSAYLEQSKEFAITPTFHYKFQGKADQLDLGIYGFYDQYVLGFWYRGIPVKRYQPRVQNNESMIFLIGWKVKWLSVTYSYDLTVSRLAQAGSGGAHELNLTYLHHKLPKRHKPMKRLPCPQFYKH